MTNFYVNETCEKGCVIIKFRIDCCND